MATDLKFSLTFWIFVMLSAQKIKHEIPKPKAEIMVKKLPLICPFWMVELLIFLDNVFSCQREYF